jgi:hypothetical protein
MGNGHNQERLHAVIDLRRDLHTSSVEPRPRPQWLVARESDNPPYTFVAGQCPQRAKLRAMG